MTPPSIGTYESSKSKMSCLASDDASKNSFSQNNPKHDPTPCHVMSCCRAVVDDVGDHALPEPSVL